jgi:hypothetical protein
MPRGAFAGQGHIILLLLEVETIIPLDYEVNRRPRRNGFARLTGDAGCLRRLTRQAPGDTVLRMGLSTRRTGTVAKLSAGRCLIISVACDRTLTSFWPAGKLRQRRCPTGGTQEDLRRRAPWRSSTRAAKQAVAGGSTKQTVPIPQTARPRHRQDDTELPDGARASEAAGRSFVATVRVHTRS